MLAVLVVTAASLAAASFDIAPRWGVMGNAARDTQVRVNETEFFMPMRDGAQL